MSKGGNNQSKSETPVTSNKSFTTQNEKDQGADIFLSKKLLDRTTMSETDAGDEIVGQSILDSSNDNQQKNSTSNPKKPIGGVSMFGNFNPSSLLNPSLPESQVDSDVKHTDQVDEQIDEDDIEYQRKEVESPSSKETEIQNNMGESARDESDLLVQDESYKVLGPDYISSGEQLTSLEVNENQHQQELSKPRKPIGGVSMFGDLNPSSLLKSSHTEHEDLEPQQDNSKDEFEARNDTCALELTHTLKTLTKTRPKIQTKRKPPTRGGRKLAIDSSNKLEFDAVNFSVDETDYIAGDPFDKGNRQENDAKHFKNAESLDLPNISESNRDTSKDLTKESNSNESNFSNIDSEDF